MDAKIINSIIGATLNTISTLASTKAQSQKPVRKKDRLTTSEVTGVLDLSGGTAGTIAISFEKPCILGIVSTMFGEEITDLNEDITDAVGEISNMICGHAVNKFGGFDTTLKIEFSRVIEGKGIELPFSTDTPIISIPITTGHGDMSVEVCIKAES